MKKTREIRNGEFTICCPICGRFQYKMLEGHTVFNCDKCGGRFEAIVRDNKLILVEQEIKTAKMSFVENSRKTRMKPVYS